jgi:hypothetical protein
VAPKPRTLREQVEAFRAARGLSPEERTARAVTMGQNWAVNAPTRGFGMVNTSRLEKLGKVIDEMERKHPAVVEKAAQDVRARMAEFAAKRQTPTLHLSPEGPKLTKPEYDISGRRTGKTEQVSVKEEQPYYMRTDTGFDVGNYLASNEHWGEYELRLAKKHVETLRNQDRDDEADKLEDAVRNFERIGRTSSLVPEVKAPAKKAAKSKAAARATYSRDDRSDLPSRLQRFLYQRHAARSAPIDNRSSIGTLRTVLNPTDDEMGAFAAETRRAAR